MFFVLFFHVVCMISNFDMWTEQHLVQASCTELTLHLRFHRSGCSVPCIVHMWDNFAKKAKGIKLGWAHHNAPQHLGLLYQPRIGRLRCKISLCHIAVGCRFYHIKHTKAFVCFKGAFIFSKPKPNFQPQARIVNENVGGVKLTVISK